MVPCAWLRLPTSQACPHLCSCPYSPWTQSSYLPSCQCFWLACWRRPSATSLWFLVTICLFLDDASKPPLSPTYRGLYKVLHRSKKFVVLQIGDKSDSISADRLKPVISASPVAQAVPPPRGRLGLVPASILRPTDPVRLPEKKVRFEVPVPASELCRNPCWMVQGSPPLSTFLRPHLLGGVICGCHDNLSFSLVLQSRTESSEAEA